MTQISKRLKHVGIAVAALAGAAMWTGAALSASHGGEKVLKVVPHADLKNIDPIWTTAYITRNHGYLVYDVLFAMDENLQVQPQMIDTYKVSDDGLQFTFTLRDGLAWHDGSPVTAEDCIASLQRWGKRDGLGQKLFEVVDSLAASDAKTFVMTLKEPYGLVIDSIGKISSNVPFMMPKAMAETDPFTQVAEPIGSGPFKFKKDEWVPGSKVVYLKNQDYKPRAEPPSGVAGGKVVKVDRMEWLYIPDQTTAMNALISGEVHYFEAPQIDLVANLKAADNVQVQVINKMGSQGWLRINHLHPPFDNVKARQAMQALVSQEDYMMAAIGNPEFFTTCAATFICDTPLDTDVNTSRIMKKDIDLAKKLMQEAGYKGEKIVLMQPTDTANLNAFSSVTAQLLREAGLNVEVQAMDWSTLTSRRAEKKAISEGGWNLFHTSWIGPDVMNPVVNIGVSGGGTEKAWFGWPTDQKIEDMRLAFAKETDPAKQKEIAKMIQERANEIVTYVPLGQFFSPIAYDKTKIEGVLDTPVPVFWNIDLKM
jgi:peptide/nickel transport system substrate-binding protein